MLKTLQVKICKIHFRFCTESYSLLIIQRDIIGSREKLCYIYDVSISQNNIQYFKCYFLEKFSFYVSMSSPICTTEKNSRLSLQMHT